MQSQTQSQTRPTTNEGRGFTAMAFVCAVVALFFLPPVFGVAGGVLGFVGKNKGDGLGTKAAITAIVCAVVGMVLGAIVLANR